MHTHKYKDTVGLGKIADSVLEAQTPPRVLTRSKYRVAQSVRRVGAHRLGYFSPQTDQNSRRSLSLRSNGQSPADLPDYGHNRAEI